jgi:hypothetical protein
MRYSFLFACLAIMALSMAVAANPVYEGFAYHNGSSLSGQNGGSGWGSPWDSSRTAPGVTIGPGLAFSSLSTSPGSASSDPPVTGLVAFYLRQLGATIGADNTTTYMSFLLRPDVGFGFYGGVNLEGLFIGKSGVVNAYGIEGPLDDVASSGVAPIAGTTVLLVLRADFLPGNDRFSLFVDPTPGAPEPSIPDALKTNYDLSPANFVFLNNAGSWTTDEIRIGSTFAAVTPLATIPEPGTLYLLAAVFPVLALRVRRGRQ